MSRIPPAEPDRASACGLHCKVSIILIYSKIFHQNFILRTKGKFPIRSATTVLCVSPINFSSRRAMSSLGGDGAS